MLLKPIACREEKIDALFKQGTKSEIGVFEVDKFFRETYALYKKM